MRPPSATPFTLKMWDLCDLAPKRVPGYNPGYFRDALREAGDDFAPRARKFLQTGIQSGLERLAQGGALDISMEWSIAFDPWPEFDEADRKLAHERLCFVAKLHGLPQPPPLPQQPRLTTVPAGIE